MKLFHRSILPLGILAATLGGGVLAFERKPAPPPAESMRAANDLSTAFRYASRAVGPAVVKVTSVQRAPAVQAGGQNVPFGLPFFFRGPGGPGGDQNGFERRGQGTGFVIDEHGTIVTNNHVVRGADTVTVETSDGRTYTAKVVGTDARTDLAVIAVEGDGLEVARLGDSDSIEVGDWVIAVGTPLGLDQTVTAGIVSAKSRRDVGITDFEDFIQTDAAINPGNSGGPLVNLNGEVIGVNTAIASQNGGNVGIGFAIPINLARSIVDQLRDHGAVRRGMLGVTIQPLTDELARSFGFDGEGVLVGDVVRDGPAAGAGIEAGDIVVSLDGKGVVDHHDLRTRIAERKPGDDVKVAVVRDGEQKEFHVTLGSLDGSGDGGSLANPSAPKLGLTVETLPPAISKRNGGLTGVIVKHVQPGGAAAEAGLRPGDVITRIDGTDVTSIADAKALMNGTDQGIRLRVWRDGQFRFVFLKSR